MIIIDTNVLVASLIEEDKNHQFALQVLNELKNTGETLSITYGVLIELSQTLYRLRDSTFSSTNVLKAFHNFNLYSLKHFNRALELYEKTSNNLSFVDCEIITIAQEQGTKIISFDKKLLNQLRK